MDHIHFPQPVPYYAQIASRTLARKVFEENLDAALDPCWAESGADTVQEYAYWVMRACGIACLKMCVEAFGGEKCSLHEWIRLGLENEAYLTVEENGRKIERGWIHSKLADMMAAAGLYAKAMPLEPLEIARYLHSGSLLIASVSYELGTDSPVTFKGGHLVVVRGMDILDGKPLFYYINNPSGRSLALQENAAIPIQRFIQAYAGRVILVRKT